MLASVREEDGEPGEKPDEEPDEESDEEHDAKKRKPAWVDASDKAIFVDLKGLDHAESSELIHDIPSKSTHDVSSSSPTQPSPPPQKKQASHNLKPALPLACLPGIKS